MVELHPCTYNNCSLCHKVWNLAGIFLCDNDIYIIYWVEKDYISDESKNKFYILHLTISSKQHLKSHFISFNKSKMLYSVHTLKYTGIFSVEWFKLNTNQIVIVLSFPYPSCYISWIRWSPEVTFCFNLRVILIIVIPLQWSRTEKVAFQF